MIRIVSAVAAMALISSPASAQDFKWHAPIAKGKTLEIRGISGTITASRASGDAEVTAEKHGRKSDPDDVEIKVVEHSDGVTICAIYPGRRGKVNTCEPGGSNSSSYDNNDVEVDFTVKVPAGVEFVGATVNGDVTATELPGDAHVSTVNGDIDVTAAGHVEASTVNGSIEATMGRSDWTGDLEFSTVNGGIKVTMPANVDADVKASTVNGSVDSDFPITMQGKMRRSSIQGRIGKGGHDLELTTVNGSIELRKGR